jgi:hypothetical protein
MKEQLESLANEMIQEIKNLKDLTKETLPIVAKEYIHYNMTMAAIGLIVFGLFFLVGLAGLIYSASINALIDKNFGPLQLVSTILFMFGTCFGIGSFITLVSFYMQPRLKAIEGVVKTFGLNDNTTK